MNPTNNRLDPKALWAFIEAMGMILPDASCPRKVFNLVVNTPQRAAGVLFVSQFPITDYTMNEEDAWLAWDCLGSVYTPASVSHLTVAIPTAEIMNSLLCHVRKQLLLWLAGEDQSCGGRSPEQVYAILLFVDIMLVFVETKYHVAISEEPTAREECFDEIRTALKRLPKYKCWHPQTQKAIRRFADRIAGLPGLCGSKACRDNAGEGRVLDDERIAFFRQFPSFRDIQHPLSAIRYKYVALLFTERRIVVDTPETQNARIYLQYPEDVEESEVLALKVEPGKAIL